MLSVPVCALDMRRLRHIDTLPTSTCALVSLAELPSTPKTPTTPVLLKSYLRSDVAKHDLTAVVQAEREALVRLSSDKSGLVAQLLSASVSARSLSFTMVRAPGSPAFQLPRPLLPARVAAITKQLCAALQKVHAVDVVHADVTLRNVIVDQANGDTVCLVDFGGCFVRGGTPRDASRTTSAHVLAPELLSGAQPDPTADVWALGVFAWALLFGGPGPLGNVGSLGASDAAVLEELQRFGNGERRIEQDFDAAAANLRSVDRQALSYARDFITTCLARNPCDRFTRIRSQSELTKMAWSDVIDYERIKLHPFHKLALEH